MLAMLLFIIQFMSGLVVIKTEFNIDYPYGLAHECQSEALGLSDGRIKDWQISASSTAVEDNISTRLARLASVKAGEAWCAGYSEREEWLQIDLGIASKVTAIATQGRSNNNDWITAFRVSYSLDFIKWNNIRNDDNSNKIFNGNLNSFNIRMIYLPHEIFTRFLRIHIIRWNGKPCLRLEVYGCQECNRDLSDPGVASFSASSEKTFYDEPLCHANNAAITSSDGWCAATFESFSDIFNDLSSLSHLRKRARQLRFQRLNARQKARFTRRLKRYRYLQKRVSRIRRNIQPEEEKRLIKSEQEPKPWLQIDLNYYKLITAIQTKGRSNKGVNEWVKQYKLAYSNDSYVWTYYREGNLLTPRFFRANNDNDSLRINYLNKPFVARYIRFIPTRAHNHVSMRAGVIGCQLKRKVCEENFFRFSESFNCIPEIKYIRPNNSFSHPLLNDDCIRPIILSLKSSDQFLKPKFNSDQNSLYNLIDLNSNYNNNQKSFRLTAKWAAELSQMESIAGVQFNITTKSLPFQWRSVNLKLNKISVYVTRHVNYVDSSLLPKRNRRYANRHVLCAKRLNINISYEKKFRLMETKKLLMQCRRNNLIGGMIVFVGHFNINIQTVTPSKSINRGQIAKVIPTLCDVHIF
ncbi:hypothetical protein SNEBB_003930 [Seison nebaliae]|nr:hypothetical protein SNEBB_003930 [Seison nebaliae]